MRKFWFRGAAAALLVISTQAFAHSICRLPLASLARITGGLLSLGYHVRANGVQQLLKQVRKDHKGTLIIASHPAYGIDAMTMVSQFGALNPRILMLPVPVLAVFIDGKHFVNIPNLTNHPTAQEIAKADAALNEIADEINRGGTVIVFPAGHIQHNARDEVMGTSATYDILQKAPKARVIFAHISGLRGSRFSIQGNPAYPDWSLPKAVISSVWDWVRHGGPLVHKRPVTVDAWEAKDFPKTGSKREINEYINHQLNDLLPNPLLAVDRNPLHSGEPRVLPEPPPRPIDGDGNVSPADFARLEPEVEKLIKEMAPDFNGPVTPTTNIKDDVGLDSLHWLDLMLKIEQHFRADLDAKYGKDFHIDNPSDVMTVGKIVALLAGASKVQMKALKPPTAHFFSGMDPRRVLTLPGRDQDSGLKTFLYQAMHHPNDVWAADQQAGEITYAKALKAIRLMSARIRQMPGNRIGVLLPPSVGAQIIRFSILAAEKEPVFLNYGSGPVKLKLAAEDAHVQTVLTSKLFMDGLDSKAKEQLNVHSIDDLYADLDKIKTEMQSWKGLPGTLYTLFQSYMKRDLERAANHQKPDDPQVTLFTTGSTGKPKEVTLTNRMLRVNEKDLEEIFPISGDSVMLSALPFFHVFGYMLADKMALSGGKTVYHPDSTDVVTMARMIPLYKVTHLVGSPTIVSSILDVATPEQLKTIRYVVTGGEKLKSDVIEKIMQKIPHAQIWEGYGLTETSPVISAGGRRGTVGKILRHVQLQIVDPSDPRETLPVGKEGLIIVRGPSVITHYGNVPEEKQKKDFLHLGAQGTPDYDHPWFVTGDKGYVDSDGYLHLTGRVSREMKIGAEKEGLDGIEDLLVPLNPTTKEGNNLAVAGIEGTGADYRLIVFTTKPLTLAQLNAQIEGKVHSAFKINRVVLVDKIPMLSGNLKIDYPALLKIFNEREPSARAPH